METPETTTIRTAGIQFRPGGTIYTFDAGGFALASGDDVVVQTERGMALGTVHTEPRDTVVGENRPARILKKANEADLAKHDTNLEKGKETHRLCVDMAQRRRLPFKIVRVEYSFDGNRATIFFYSEQQVDYRHFVRDLAGRLQIRIEMRSVGARDHAKIIGGMGPCGRELCCSSWLRDFHAVSIKMAKAQDLSLNPSKLAGMCGRLKCCLRYEYETYLELRQGLPKAGKKVLCVKGDGVVVRQVPLRQSVIIRREEDDVEVEATLEDLVARKDDEAAPADDRPAPPKASGPKGRRRAR